MTTTPSAIDDDHRGSSGREALRLARVDGLLALAIGVAAVAPFLLYPSTILVVSEDAIDEFSAGTSTGLPDRWLAAAVAAAIVAPLVVRRIWPRVSFVAVLLLTVTAALPAVVEATDSASLYVLGANLPLLVSVFTLANLVGRRAAVATGVVGAAGMTAAVLLPYAFEDGMAPFLWMDMLNTAAYAVLPIALVVIVAQVLRDQRIRADAAQRETAMAIVTAELRAATATSAERRRLASELHDIVAHHVNLMVVQAEKGPYVRDGEDTSRTFGTIAETGRAALGELDRLLGVLRTDGSGSVGAPSTAPLPTLHEVPSLVESANRAGVAVELQRFDVPALVDTAVSTTVHRIVQECITNVVKHADHTEPAVVDVTTEGDTITVRVTNRVGAERAGGRRGHGLDSMRSRLAVFGGVLRIDDRDGWFRVEAVVPLAEPMASRSSAAVTA